MTRFGVMTDYEYSAEHKRNRITVWSGAFMGTFEAEGYSLPKGDGYMLTTYNGDKVRVSCAMRNNSTYPDVDAAISRALAEHYAAIGATTVLGNSPELEARVAAVHDWGRAYMTGARACQRCGLLPLDEDDAALPCEVEETEEWQD